MFCQYMLNVFCSCSQNRTLLGLFCNIHKIYNINEDVREMFFSLSNTSPVVIRVFFLRKKYTLLIKWTNIKKSKARDIESFRFYLFHFTPRGQIKAATDFNSEAASYYHLFCIINHFEISTRT